MQWYATKNLIQRLGHSNKRFDLGFDGGQEIYQSTGDIKSLFIKWMKDNGIKYHEIDNPNNTNNEVYIEHYQNKSLHIESQLSETWEKQKKLAQETQKLLQR